MQTYNFQLVCMDTEGKKSSANVAYKSPDNFAKILYFELQF